MTFATKGDARAFLSAVETDIRRGRGSTRGPAACGCRELAKEWIAADPTKRESTTAREELTLRLHVLPILGDLRIEQVGPQDVQRLVNAWSTGHAPRTVKRNYEVVRAMFGYAVRNDWLARNPCRNIKLPPVDGTRRYDLTPEDVVRIAAHVDRRVPPDDLDRAALGPALVRGGRAPGRPARSQDRPARRSLKPSSGGSVAATSSARRSRRPATAPCSCPGRSSTCWSAHLERAGLTVERHRRPRLYRRDGRALRYSNWRRRIWLPATEAAGCAERGSTTCAG